MSGFFEGGFKKFTAFVLVLLASCVMTLMGDMTQEQFVELLKWSTGAYLVGQGVADIGKGKALVESNGNGSKPPKPAT